MTGRLWAAARGASLRARVMAAAAVLVAVTSLVTGVLSTTLLRSYLLGRSDAQLRDFARVASWIAERPRLRPPHNGQRQVLPTQFLVEVVSADGRVQVEGGPLHASSRPQLTAAQLNELGTPYTAQAAGAAAHSWRVLVQRGSGGGLEVIAYSLDDLDSTVHRCCPELGGLSAWD